jgi:hypothetical protein
MFASGAIPKGQSAKETLQRKSPEVTSYCSIRRVLVVVPEATTLRRAAAELVQHRMQLQRQAPAALIDRRRRSDGWIHCPAAPVRCPSTRLRRFTHVAGRVPARPSRAPSSPCISKAAAATGGSQAVPATNQSTNRGRPRIVPADTKTKLPGARRGARPSCLATASSRALALAPTLASLKQSDGPRKHSPSRRPHLVAFLPLPNCYIPRAAGRAERGSSSSSAALADLVRFPYSRKGRRRRAPSRVGVWEGKGREGARWGGAGAR